MSEDISKISLNEPEMGDGLQRITFFASLESENEAQYERWRNMTPVEWLEEHRQLSLIVYGDYPKYTGNRLTFE